MSEEKFSNYYTYLSKASKREFAGMYTPRITIDDIVDWNLDNDLGLKHYQMDDLLHIETLVLEEWKEL